MEGNLPPSPPGGVVRRRGEHIGQTTARGGLAQDAEDGVREGSGRGVAVEELPVLGDGDAAGGPRRGSGRAG